MDIIVYTNSPLVIVEDLSAYATVYNLATSAFRMQFGRLAGGEGPSGNEVFLDIKTGGTVGSALYDATSHYLCFQCDSTRLAALTGPYDWGYGFTPAGGAFIGVRSGKATCLRRLPMGAV